MKRIGIVGSGNMGRTIGLNFASKGHQVYFGHRRQQILDSIQELAGELPVQTGNNQEAVLQSDVILYCLRDVPPSELVERDLWAGKIVIDLNNWPNPAEPFQYEPIPISIAEHHQKDIPNAHVVKAFNTLPQEIFNVLPSELEQYGASGFYCGDDAQATETVAALIAEIGLAPVDCGGLNQARILESMGNLIRVLIQKQGLGIAYSVTKIPLPTHLPYGPRETTQLK